MKRDAEETVTELGRQLGLTPVSRLRVGIVHERPEEAADEAQRTVAIIDEYRRRLAGP